MVKSAVLIILVPITVITIVEILGFGQINAVEEVMRSETLDVAVDRIETTIYAVRSLGKSKTQIEFDSNKYGLEKDGGDYYLTYEFNDNTERSKIEGPYGTPITASTSSGGPWEKFRVFKDTVITLGPGGCTW
jgi:hypothetical protein